MGKTFVVGDIHGAYHALRQCLDRCGFDYDHDHLISLGDIVDGWPDTFSCIEEFLKIRHRTFILGNHDQWALQWMKSGVAGEIWMSQGGKATIASYTSHVPPSHVALLNDALPYYLADQKLFVHAGINPLLPLDIQGPDTFLWDRNLARTALSFKEKNIEGKLSEYDEVFVGHTPVSAGGPVKACDVWLMDTGAGWSGVLSMMDIHTKEIFTSDPVPSLYPGISGRQTFR